MGDDRHEMEQGQEMPVSLMMVGIGLVVVTVILLLMMRSRRKSRTDRALDRISEVIEDAELPSRAKDILIDTVEEVRNAMATLRSRANELRG